MKADKIHRQQMLKRVFNFGQTHLHLFPKQSAAADIVASLGRAVEKLGDQASEQVSGTGNMRSATLSGRKARQALKIKVESIGRTATALKLGMFYLPQSKSDAAYIACAQTFARQAQALKKEFIEHGFPPDFVETLNMAITDLQRTTISQRTSKGTRSDSIAGFEETLKATLPDLKRFDVLVRNAFENEPGIMAAWRMARHVGRPRSARAVAVKPA